MPTHVDNATLAHARPRPRGEFFPYQYGRLSAGFARWPALRELGRRPPRDYLRWFAYDTVLFDDAPTHFLLDLVGPGA